MASLGQLAAGVAHEINNPMGFVFSNLSTFRDYFTHIAHVLELYGLLGSRCAGASPDIREVVDEIERYKREVEFDYLMKDSPEIISDSLEGASRVVEIVKNLKEFSHVDEASMQLANLNMGIESTLRLIWNELKYKVELEKDYGDIGEIECYPQQINQVFLNLLMNAAQAIDKAGTIRIRTRREPGGVSVVIQDTGCGISKEHLSKIFDPFFTTKPIGKGTGLGLSLVYGIVRKHHGHIDVASQPGQGTTFTLHLPERFVAEPANGGAS
jgi:signal transduction histidine kinase